VLELTGKTAPRSGLEGKFSVYHACAAGIVFGKAGEAEFADAIVARADMVGLRNRVQATADPGIGEASADVTIVCTDGRRFHTFVQHAIGSLERPMTDANLDRKFHDLVDPVLSAARHGVAEQCARSRVHGPAGVRGADALAPRAPPARCARRSLRCRLCCSRRVSGPLSPRRFPAVRRRSLSSAPRQPGRDVAAYAGGDGGADAADGEDHEPDVVYDLGAGDGRLPSSRRKRSALPR
jgi:hypothetical protein